MARAVERWVVLRGPRDFAEFQIRPFIVGYRSGESALLRHAVRLSRASGVPIEQFVGDEEEED